MKWNPFKRGDKGGDKPASKSSSSGLGPGVSGPAGAGDDKPAKRGLLGRMFGRKPKPPAAPKREDKSKDTPVPAPPSGPGPEGSDGEGAVAEAKPPRVYPSSLHVSATGWWQFSKKAWHGTASGTITGIAVRQYIDALEAGQLELCIYLIAEAYDDGSDFARHLNIAESSVEID